MKRNRIEIDTRLLSGVMSADYVDIRKKNVKRCKNTLQWLKEDSKKPHEKYRQKAIDKHFKHHSGHCSVCHVALESFIYPLDSRIKDARGRWGITRLTACKLHTQELGDYPYTDRHCLSCGCEFRASGTNQYCSLSCSSFAGYHKRKAQVKQIDCRHCKESFTPKRKDAKYCGAKCRVSANRKKKIANTIKDSS